ncbi:MAG TPA: FAD:protein FMN transferase [bacterium]|nr:FAD:protein FMN transferase [bacterium]HPN42908.1 FAD:protein FMN transferase [bacterium]
MKKNIFRTCGFVTALLTLTFAHCSKTRQFDLVTMTGRTMGTTFSIKIAIPENSGQVQEALEKQIYALLDTVNMQMSTYLETSELSRFNTYRGSEWFPVSPPMALVMGYAQHISAISGGAFDITVGPLVNLWGFGPEVSPDDLPPDAEVQKRKQLVGYINLQVRKDPPALQKAIPDMYCDLSAIAKGYGVDVVADYLLARGYKNILVEIGGEIRSAGHNHHNKKWRIGISSPVTEPGIQKVLTVDNCGVATSGDYRNYFEKDGIRYSHTIDPSTGRPITHKLASVTVLHDSCMVADGLATAINVLGPEKGYEFAINQNLMVFMIVKSDTGFVEKMTPGFEKLLDELEK